MTRLINYFLLSAIVVTLLFVTCSAPPCEENGPVKVNVGLYHIHNNVLRDTLVDSLSVILGKQLDTVYIDEMNSLTKEFSVPLSMNSDTSKIVLQFDKTESDTLTFYYNRVLKMVSHECGFVNFFEITKIENTTNKIDSVRIPKELIEYGTKENIKIYM